MIMAETILDEKIKLKRVRVTINRIEDDVKTTGNDDGFSGDGEGSSHPATRDILRITASDNGIGMQNIKQSVSAFCTSKPGVAADNESSKLLKDQQCNSPSTKKSSNSTQSDSNIAHTEGRYGIGINLCLLHDQRLLSNTCALFTSTVSYISIWMRARSVVDMDKDRSICIKKESVEKSKRNKEEESGTAVSPLLPRGKAAQSAWPLLVEYFTRFQFSISIKCSLHVSVPSLSRVPLFICPPFEVERRRLQREKRGEETKLLQGRI